MANDNRVIAGQLDPELYQAVVERCEAEAISASDLVRALCREWINGGMPTVDEQYRTAKALAIRMFRTFATRLAEELPDSYEEAMQMISEM